MNFKKIKNLIDQLQSLDLNFPIYEEYDLNRDGFDMTDIEKIRDHFSGFSSDDLDQESKDIIDQIIDQINR